MVAAMASGAAVASSSSCSQLMRTEGCSPEGGRVALELSQLASFASRNAGFRRRVHGRQCASAPASLQPVRVNLAQQMKKMQVV